MPTLPSDKTTLLEITGIDVPPYSARGLRQTYAPVFSNLRRTVNGEFIDLTPEQFKSKVKSTITGNDVQPPAFDGIYPGAVITVSCAKELGYRTAGGAPSRTVVSGSERVDGAFTYYRPIIVFRIVHLSENFSEWENGNEWTLELEEV